MMREREREPNLNDDTTIELLKLMKKSNRPTQKPMYFV